MKRLSSLSLFFPFWNEEKNVEKVILAAIPVIEKVAEKWEIIMVDDGSADKTFEVAQQLAKKHKNLRAISHMPNRGYGAALKEGFKNAVHEYVAFADGDGQFAIEEITKFTELAETTDIVIGYRKTRRDNLKRHILMYLLKVWDFIFFGFYFKDIDCGFKLFKKEALEKIMPFRSEGAMITTEILAKAKIKRLKIKEVEVNHYPREFGDQSGGNMYVVIRAILESFTLWWDLRNGRF